MNQLKPYEDEYPVVKLGAQPIERIPSMLSDRGSELRTSFKDFYYDLVDAFSKLDSERLLGYTRSDNYGNCDDGRSRKEAVLAELMDNIINPLNNLRINSLIYKWDIQVDLESTRSEFRTILQAFTLRVLSVQASDSIKQLKITNDLVVRKYAVDILFTYVDDEFLLIPKFNKLMPIEDNILDIYAAR